MLKSIGTKEKLNEENPRESNFYSFPILTDDSGDGFLFCMVYQESSKDAPDYIRIMKTLGLEVKLNVHSTTGVIYAFIDAPMDVLRSYAVNTGQTFLSDTDELQKFCQGHGIELGDNKREVSLAPHELIQLHYVSCESIPESVYWRPAEINHPFRDLIKYALSRQLIESKPAGNAQNIKIARYLKTGKIISFFPLHNPNTFEVLYSRWITKYETNEAVQDQIKVICIVIEITLCLLSLAHDHHFSVPYLLGISWGASRFLLQLPIFLRHLGKCARCRWIGISASRVVDRRLQPPSAPILRCFHRLLGDFNVGVLEEEGEA